MRLKWRGSSRSEDKFETWLSEQYQEHVLGEHPAPVSGSCPDEEFLNHLARRSPNISLSDPRVGHAASCPTCMKKILLIRRERAVQQRRRLVMGAAVACIFIVAVVVMTVRYTVGRRQSANELAVVTRTVDLWNSGTYRGDQPAHLESVSLPPALTKVNIILPRFSEPGRYTVSVARDQMGADLVAQAKGLASTQNDRKVVAVTLDLRSAKAGPYFLSTTRDQDQSSYYYPLDIR